MRFEPSIKVAYIVACATLLSGAIGFRGAVRALNAFLHKQPAPLREPLTTLPMTFGKWRSMTKDEQLAPEVIEELGTSSYLNRVYSIDGDPAKGSLHLHIAFYTGMIDSVPHVPERCFTAGGGLEERAPPKQIRVPVDRSRWRDGEGPTNLASGARYPLATVADPVTLRQDEVVLPLGETLLTMIEFEQKNDPELLILGGYFFVANGRITPSAYSIRNIAFSLQEKYAYYCKVQFTGRYRGNSAAVEQYQAEVADLLAELLPHLMRRLPNWPEYEARTVEASAEPTRSRTTP